MSLLDMLKTLLNIDLNDKSKDNILNYIINNSKIKIDNYLVLNTDFKDVIKDLEFEEKYFNAIVELSKYDFNNMKNIGIKSYTESKRSVTYKDSNNNNGSTSSLPQEIIDLLPKKSNLYLF